jgi:hypothetical protein
MPSLEFPVPLASVVPSRKRRSKQLVPGLCRRLTSECRQEKCRPSLGGMACWRRNLPFFLIADAIDLEP